MEEMQNHVDKQTNWITQLTYEDIPEDVVTRARWVLLDSIGCILNGLHGNKLPSEENARILKSSAAMVSTELYEGNRFAIGHPASHIVPVLLEETEKRDLSYAEMLKIFAGAYELASRWGSSIRFSNDILGHGTVMIAGAAAVEGLLYQFPPDRFSAYLMLCESLPEVSTWQSVFEGSTLHDYYPGIATVNAKNALYMTAENVTSSKQLVCSIYDKVIGAAIMEENLSGQLGELWYLRKNYFKVHTGCRFIHPFADVLEKQLKKGLDRESIEEIRIYTYKKAARLTSQTAPNTLSAMFSIPVSLATLIVKGHLYPEDISEATELAEIRNLSSRIYLLEEEQYNALLPDIRGGRVEIKKTDGTWSTEEVFHAKGDCDHPEPFTETELTEKFYRVTEKYINKRTQDSLVQKILKGSESIPAGKILEDYYNAV